MIIGIAGNTFDGKKEISEYLNNNYKVRYFDIDEILGKIMSKENYCHRIEENDWRSNEDLLIRVNYEINQIIQEITRNISKDELLVLDYSLLENSYFINNCDAIIRVNNNENLNFDNYYKELKQYMRGNIDTKINSSIYHLDLDLNNNWQTQLKEYIEYNLFYNKKVTVVVPIYNTANYLFTCVNSIINQSYRNLEILLIDDGSTDESLKICNLLAEKDSRISVIHQDNIGLAETRNRGIELATGEYICFIDSDDYIENSMIEKLLKAIEETNADVCEGSFYIHFKNGEIRDVTCEQKNNSYISGKLNLINAFSDATILIPAWDKLYRLSSIKNVKFDKNSFKEDNDYIYRLCIG